MVPFRALALLSLAALAPPSLGQVDRPDPSLAFEPWGEGQAVSARALVTFSPEHDRTALLDELGLQLQRELPHGLTLITDPSARELASLVDALSGRAEVLAVQPDLVLSPVGTPSDPKWPQQWGPLLVGVANAWDLEAGAPATVIAVLDSGADLDHADLQSQIAWGLDTFSGDDTPSDLDGHGSHCAGIASAAGDDGVGVAGAAGLCRLAIYRCGNGTFPTSSLLLALDDAVTRGARVLSLSWGSYGSNPALRQGVLAAVDAGCVVVAAAGNDGVDTPFYPAAWPEVLAVASSNPFDGRSAFSNHGTWVELTAPGQSILSTWKTGGWTSMSGTSMACPLVAGVAGLLYARLGGARSVEHAELVQDALTGSAIPVGSWVSEGRLDPAAAVSLLDTWAPPPVANLTIADTAAEGHDLVLDLRGPAGSPAALLVAPLGTTASVKGMELLLTAQLLMLGSLPADGQLSLSTPVPASVVGASAWWQLLVQDPSGGLYASEVLSTNFTP
jgi:thermitase